MKALGKCLICTGIIAEEEIPPEHEKIYLNLTEIFITYLSGNELLEKSQLLSHLIFSAVFPFCTQCRKIVTTLYRHHLQTQTGLRRIQQIISKSRALKSHCDGKKNSVELPTKSSDSRTTYVMKKQQSELLLKPGVKAVTSRDLLIRTGPDTFVYLGKYGIERAEDHYRCSTCGHLGRTRGEVSYHIRMAHAPPIPHRRNIRMVEKSPNMWYYDEFAAEKVGDTYCCVACRFTHKVRPSMRDHLRYSHYVVAHPEDAPPNSFVCEVCGKVHTSAFTLKMHQHSHDDEPSLTCKHCGERFNTWHKLKFHARKHLGEKGKKFMCEHCGQRFWQQSDLKNHLFRHTGKREFICKICGKSYGSSVGLYKHLDSHTGRKYFCDLCDMEFTMADSVVRHKRTAHGVLVVRTKQKNNGTHETTKKVLQVRM